MDTNKIFHNGKDQLTFRNIDEIKQFYNISKKNKDGFKIIIKKYRLKLSLLTLLLIVLVFTCVKVFIIEEKMNEFTVEKIRLHKKGNSYDYVVPAGFFALPDSLHDFRTLKRFFIRSFEKGGSKSDLYNDYEDRKSFYIWLDSTKVLRYHSRYSTIEGIENIKKELLDNENWNLYYWKKN